MQSWWKPCRTPPKPPSLSAAASTDLPVVACMVFGAGKNKDRTMMGTTPEQAVEILSKQVPMLLVPIVGRELKVLSPFANG